MEKTTLFLDHNIKCVYYPSTRSVLIEDELTRECVILNCTNWHKVFEWLNALQYARIGN